MHPNCNRNDIYDSGVVSKNWYKAKDAIEYLVRCKVIQSANWWTVQVYFVRQYLEPEERITANHLFLKDELFRAIKSIHPLFNEFASHYGLKPETSSMPKGIFEKELMHYQAGLGPILSYREQILRKFVIIYFQMVKIMLLQYRRDKETCPEQATFNKDWREREMITFLLGFLDFVYHDGKRQFISGRFRTGHELSSNLDSKYHDCHNHYKRLTQNANPLQVVIDTYYLSLLQTRTDAAQDEDITRKQVSNRIRPYEKSDGAPDIAKLYRQGQVESGMGFSYLPSDEAMLYNLYAMREALCLTPKGPKYNKIKKDAEQIFPGIT